MHVCLIHEYMRREIPQTKNYTHLSTAVCRLTRAILKKLARKLRSRVFAAVHSACNLLLGALEIVRVPNIKGLPSLFFFFHEKRRRDFAVCSANLHNPHTATHTYMMPISRFPFFPQQQRDLRESIRLVLYVLPAAHIPEAMRFAEP